ncbi:MAG TPA: bifunctional 2-keto-4-hydroxyglutarate aldolase/2-keto-3-deoxy-6-phosphogluconate aldolase [Armatimonadota bacterium]|nr:bifunctional 2-keto-4-hydroxyglutarate aldolase/2-keto-3-deoxy-6-phosphogluconate aldolase [Armatimonadota bacterium]
MPSSAETMQRIADGGLVAVVRADNEEQALKIADACMQGGVAALEITYTVPGATRVIERLAQEYTNGEILIGAGTVLDPETARVAILAGAQFIVSPYLNVDVVKLCNRYDIPCVPGAMTIKEVVEALNAGAPMVKAFPGEVLGPAFIKAVRGPIPHVKLIPTGGVSLDNVDKWIKAGCIAVGVGGNLTAGAKTGNYAAITDTARQFIAKIQDARKK